MSANYQLPASNVHMPGQYEGRLTLSPTAAVTTGDILASPNVPAYYDSGT